MVGISKQYLRYAQESVYGLVATGTNIHYIKLDNSKKYIVVSACENVFIWDVRKKTVVSVFNDENIEGRVLCVEPRPLTNPSANTTHIAVGYSGGTVAIYNIATAEHVKFNGFKTGVTTLAWDPEAMRLASGSFDGEIVVWDVVSERGIVRLCGHKGSIFRIRFMETRNILMSCAKDSYIKFWDLNTNYCFCTFSKHHTDVWDFILFKNDSYLCVGGNNAEILVWKLNFIDSVGQAQDDAEEKKIEPCEKKLILDDKAVPTEENELAENDYVRFVEAGSLVRSHFDRVLAMSIEDRCMTVMGRGGVVDIYALLTTEETDASIQHRIMKKMNKRMRSKEGSEPFTSGDRTPMLTDILRKIPSLRLKEKALAVAIGSSPEGASSWNEVVSSQSAYFRVAVVHNNNLIAFYDAQCNQSPATEHRRMPHETIHLEGHRKDIRDVKVNSHGTKLVTASTDSIKVWFRDTGQVISTVECEEMATCLLIVPGDRQVVVGTRKGTLSMYDLGSGKCLHTVQGHNMNDNETDVGVWATALTYNSKGFLSAGSDCMVKFWNFELSVDEETETQILIFNQEDRALKLADQPTAVECSDCGTYFAVATLDLKETVYYFDSLKLMHEFYGKSMPASCLAFSSDSSLIVTGSRDSCIRIFAVDFGDQKRLLKNCHTNGVTSVKFVTKTHYFFSCGFDGTIKQWNADLFELIVTLRGHINIIRCLAVCPLGRFVVSCGQDMSMRVWHKTEEILVVEDEQERERQRLANQNERQVIPSAVIAGEQIDDIVRPTRVNRDTEKAVDDLMEALVTFRNVIVNPEEAKSSQVMQLIYNTTDPFRFMLLVLRRIKSSELEEAILLLKLDLVLVLLVSARGILARDWDVELATRVIVLAVRANLPQLIGAPKAAPVLRSLSAILTKMKIYQKTIGFNLAGLRHLQQRIEDRTETKLFLDAAADVRTRHIRYEKKRRIKQRAILTI